jgi:hypothetical protein
MRTRSEKMNWEGYGIHFSIFQEYSHHFPRDTDENYGETQVSYRLAVEPSEQEAWALSINRNVR